MIRFRRKTLASAIAVLVVIALLGIIIYNIYDFINDHRCYVTNDPSVFEKYHCIKYYR